MPLLEEARKPIGEMKREGRLVYSLVLLALSLAIGYISVVRGQRPPVFGWADLGVHELGHRLFFWAPQVVTAMMGNGTQALVPFLFALYFACRPWFPVGKLHGRDWAATGFCLAWTAICLQDASPYIADAPYQSLPLLHPGSIHDWAFILGPDHFDAYDQAQHIANVVWDVAWGFWLVGLAVCLLAVVDALLTVTDRRRPAADVPQTTIPTYRPHADAAPTLEEPPRFSRPSRID